MGARRHRVSRRTARTRPGSSASTRGRWARRAIVRSGSRCTRSARKGTVPLGWALYLPEEWCCGCAAPAQGEDPRGGRLSRPSRSSGWSSRSAPRAGRSTGRRCSATAPTARTPSCATACMTAGFSTCCRSPRRRRCSPPETEFTVPAAPAGERGGRLAAGRDRTARPSQIGALIARLGEEAFKTVDVPRRPRGQTGQVALRLLRVRSAHHWRRTTNAGRRAVRLPRARSG